MFSGKGKCVPKTVLLTCLEKDTNMGEAFHSSIHQYQKKRLVLFSLDENTSLFLVVEVLFCLNQAEIKL